MITFRSIFCKDDVWSKRRFGAINHRMGRALPSGSRVEVGSRAIRIAAS